VAKRQLDGFSRRDDNLGEHNVVEELGAEARTVVSDVCDDCIDVVEETFFFANERERRDCAIAETARKSSAEVAAIAQCNLRDKINEARGGERAPVGSLM